MRSRAILAIAIVSALGRTPVEAAGPTAAGLWEQSDTKGHVGGWFFIFEQDGVYNWPLCSKKLGLARQVAEIKQL